MMKSSSFNTREVAEVCENSAYGMVSVSEEHVYDVIGQQKP